VSLKLCGGKTWRERKSATLRGVLDVFESKEGLNLLLSARRLISQGSDGKNVGRVQATRSAMWWSPLSTGRDPIGRSLGADALGHLRPGAVL
jgi:hypothetical protein